MRRPWSLDYKNDTLKVEFNSNLDTFFDTDIVYSDIAA